MTESPVNMDATRPRIFVVEIWQRFRPYLIDLVVDLLISVSAWLVLYGFKWLAHQLPIAGWAGEFIVNIHAAGAVGAFAIFATLYIIDIVNIRRGKRK